MKFMNLDYCWRRISESVEGFEWGQNEKRIEREMDLINQMTDDSMVDTEKNMSIEIPEGEDRYAYSYRRYNKRAGMYRA